MLRTLKEMDITVYSLKLIILMIPFIFPGKSIQM